MDYNEFVFNDSNCLIVHKREKYTRTKSGQNWRSKPEEITEEIYSNEQYQNFVRSIPFFDGFCGGKCYAKHSYEFVGYLPTTIVSVSPGKEIKYVDTFRFEYFPRRKALWEGEFREKDIIDNLKWFEVLHQNDHKMLKLFHSDGEHTAIFDLTTLRWVG